MSRKRKYRKVRWPWGQGLDKRQARRSRRRQGRLERSFAIARWASLNERIWDREEEA